MDIFKQFATDPNKELEGVWVRIGGTEEKPCRIKVARSGNKRHQRLITQMYEANRTTLDLKNDAADEKSTQITVDAMAKSILLGWEGMEFDGRAVKDGWDIKEATTLLGVKDFRELVARHANDFQKYKLAQDEVDLGN